jgi:hypothetical protein
MKYKVVEVDGSTWGVWHVHGSKPLAYFDDLIAACDYCDSLNEISVLDE